MSMAAPCFPPLQPHVARIMVLAPFFQDSPPPVTYYLCRGLWGIQPIIPRASGARALSVL